MKTTPRRMQTAAVALMVGAMCSTSALAQCPDNIPPSLVNSIQDPELRRQAAASPRVTPAFIAQNGGLTAMIQQLRAQIAADNRWLAEEQGNQATLAQQGVTNDQRARTGRDLIQKMRDKQRLDRAYLQLLECHARTPGRTPAAAGLETDRSAASAGFASSQREADEDARSSRSDMVNRIVRSWEPPRGYAGGSPAAGISLDDPFATPQADGCSPVISFYNVRLGGDGTTIDFGMSAVQTSGRPCTVSFAVELRVGTRLLKLPSRTLEIPPAGVTAEESVKLPVPVDGTTTACTEAEPLRRAFLTRRDQLAARYQDIQKAAADTVNHRRMLERSVGMRDVGNAILALGATVDTAKVVLSVVAPHTASALDLGECVGVELSTYVGKTVAACGGKHTDECVDTVVQEGGVWVEKNLACAFQQTFSQIDRVVDIVQIYRQLDSIQESAEARARTVEVLDALDSSLAAAAGRLARIRDDRSFIDESVRQLDQLCRSPQIQLTAVDVRALSGTGK